MAKGRGYSLPDAVRRRRRPSIARAFVWTALVADMVVTAAIMLPIEPVNSTWWNLAVKLNEDFARRSVAHTWNRYGVLNEETRNHPDIFVCRHLRES
jgi:hypothetical protein